MARARPVGLTALVVDVDATDSAIRKRAELMMSKTPEGRCCAVAYEMPQATHRRLPRNWVEAVSVEVFLGPPSDRSEGDEWEFFGTIAVRLCRPRVGKRLLMREAGVIIFRRKGEKAYKRRLSASKDLLESSKLEALQPAFTRDVANNVWHMRNGRGLNHVIDRLGSLLAWSDERILVSDMTTIRARSRKRPAYNEDLIGRPTKYPYEEALDKPDGLLRWSGVTSGYGRRNGSRLACLRSWHVSVAVECRYWGWPT